MNGQTGTSGNPPRGISDDLRKTGRSHLLQDIKAVVNTRGVSMLLRGKRRAPAGKPFLRYISLTVIALLVGISAGHAIDARGGSEDGSTSDATEPGRGSRNVPTVDSPHSVDGAVALEGSIGTQGYDNRDINNSSNQELCLCLLLIVRDEESNLKANLPLWRDVAHCYVIGVDDRTTDGTMQAIHEALDEDTPRFVFRYTFEDFSQARNTVMRSTWQNFPQASHILIADADWRPTLATVDLSELDFHHRSFHFLIWDHTGHTTRLAGWLLRSDERLRFKYRIHETLDNEAVSTESGKLLGWEVRVVESDSSWHTAVHGHSRAAERFLFDLKLLGLDYADDPTDLHTLFYLGITTFSYMETLIGKGTHNKTAELNALIADGMFYFQQAVDLYGERRNLDYVWSSIRWLAYGYHYFMGNSQEAERLYLQCIDYDPSRVDCIAFLSRVHLDSGNLVDAWDQAKSGLIHQFTQYRPVDYFYIYECFAPIQAATVISKRITAGSIGGDSLEGLLTLGSYLLRHHRDHCKHGVLVDTPEDIDNLESWFTASARQEGVDVAETKRRTLQIDDVSLLKVLLSKWGTGKKAVEYAKRVSISVQETPKKPEDDIVDGAFADLPGGSKVKGAPASAPTLDAPREATLDSPRETTMGGGEKITGQESAYSPPLMNGASCASIAHEARERLLGPDSRGGAGPRKANRGVLAAASMTQINDAKAAAKISVAAAARGDGTGPFRALIFGGCAGGAREGLDHEELLQVVSLLVQQPSESRDLDVTYAHPDRPTLEAARAVTSRCSKELGISGGVLQFVHSTLDDFLDTTINQTFDYVDLGGPLSRSGGGGGGRVRHGRSNDSGGGETSVLNAETLRRLGSKLAPGACLRVWAFAANPTTEAMFRVAARRTSSSGGATGAFSSVIGREKTAGLLGEVLHTSFDIGHERPQGGLVWGVGVAASDTFTTGTTTEGGFESADESVTPEHGRVTGKATEEAWVRQVLAGGHRLGFPDIDEVLTEGGFELTIMLGEAVSRPEDGVAGARGLSAMDLLQEGMTQWENADFADSLAATPRLVNQVLAVWRGG